MKKIALFILVMILTCALNAQVTQSKVLKYDEFSVEYTGTAADTIGIADSIWYYALSKKSDFKQFVSLYAEIDSTGGTADTVTMYLQGKAHDNDATYTNIDTIIWTMTGDTIIRWTPVSSYMYKNWRFYMKADADEQKAKIPRIDWEFRND